MPRIDDYNTYVSGKSQNFSNEHYFISDLNYTDVNFQNTPPQIQDVDDVKCQIEYEASVTRNKRGIDGVNFKIHRIELEVMVDDYPNEPQKFEFEIIPEVNINPVQVTEDILDHVIPTYPKEITIDMRKSMDVKDFRVIVQFGKDD